VVLVAVDPGQNLPGLLEQAEAAYRERGASAPSPTREMRVQHAARFAAGVRLGLTDPTAVQRVYEVTGGIRNGASLTSMLPAILDGALSLMGADFGNVQLRDPVTGTLRIVTQSGFDSKFLDYFATVDDNSSACGRAALGRAQTVIADVEADPGFAPHRHIAAVSGFRAVQSTPLIDRAGHTIGVLSTHFERPRRPSRADMQIIDLYAHLAANAIGARLSTVHDDNPDDAIGRAIVAALLDATDGHARGISSPPRTRQQSDLGTAGDSDDQMSRLADLVVTRLFSVALTLDGARSILEPGAAHDRISAATAELDGIIRAVRAVMLTRAQNTHTPDQAGS
jgi:GAF domain-containing protein